MSDTKTRTVVTAYGETTVETVECASCEMEVPKADAKRFLIGDLGYDSTPDAKTAEYRFRKEDIRAGWACEKCIGHEIIGFPTWADIREDSALVILVVCMIVVAMVAEAVVFVL